MLFFLLLPLGADEKGHLLTGYSQCFIICMNNRTGKSQQEPTAKEGNGGKETPAFAYLCTWMTMLHLLFDSTVGLSLTQKPCVLLINITN